MSRSNEVCQPPFKSKLNSQCLHGKYPTLCNEYYNSLLKVSEVTPNRLNIVNLLASVYETKP